MTSNNNNTYAYVGAENSGLYRLSPGADSWEELTNGLPENPIVPGVAVHPSNPSIIFAGTRKDPIAALTGAITGNALTTRPWRRRSGPSCSAPGTPRSSTPVPPRANSIAASTGVTPGPSSTCQWVRTKSAWPSHPRHWTHRRPQLPRRNVRCAGSGRRDAFYRRWRFLDEITAAWPPARTPWIFTEYSAPLHRPERYS